MLETLAILTGISIFNGLKENLDEYKISKEIEEEEEALRKEVKQRRYDIAERHKKGELL